MTSDLHRVRVFLFPAIESQQDADRILSRLAWYLHPHAENLHSVHAAIPEPLLNNIRLSADLDPKITEYLPWLCKKVASQSPEELWTRITNGNTSRDVFFMWDVRSESDPQLPVAETIKAYQKHGGFYRIDPDRTRMEGSHLLWAGLNKFCDIPAIIEAQRERFKALAADVGQHERAYVFGTGPSFSEFVQDHDFSDGLTIIANSIVKNKEAVKILKPKIICAADPIYHAGASTYASAFRAELIDTLSTTGAWFVCPLRDYPIYNAAFPTDLRQKIVAIPFDAKNGPAIDLSEQFYLSPYPNVLTLGLLPLASTFARQINIVGCDGRRIVDDSFFWSHDKKVQFNDKMTDIQSAHPAFFNIDYNDYYMGHCKDLEYVLAAIEASGRTVKSLTPSLIPALATRCETTSGKRNPLACIAMIDPDAKDEWGHFLAYDKRIGGTVKRHNLDFALICRSELEVKYCPTSTDHFLPYLTINSWTIGNKGLAKSADVLTFAQELDRALEKLSAWYQGKSVCLFFYVGSVQAAEIIEHLLMYRPNVYAVVNLFWSYNFDQSDPEYRKSWQTMVLRQNKSNRISLLHSTEQIAEEFTADWGVSLPVLPHPSTTFSDDAAAKLVVKRATERTSRIFGENGVRVLFPGGARKEKGFVLSIDTCTLLAQKPGIRPILRTRLDKTSGPELQQAFARLNTSGIELIDSNLSDDEFVEMIAQSDIVVIPYHSEAFRRRTSGILVDSMLLGKPVIVLENTWLSDVVTKYGIGKSVAADPSAICDAVSEIIEQKEDFFRNIESAGHDYAKESSWLSLTATLVSITCLHFELPWPTKCLSEPMRDKSQQHAVSKSMASHHITTEELKTLALSARLLLEPDSKNAVMLNIWLNCVWDSGDTIDHARRVLEFSTNEVY